MCLPPSGAVSDGPTARRADVSAVATLLGEFQEVFEEGRPDDHTLSFKNCRTTFTSPGHHYSASPTASRAPHCM
jgi:hypothetical protein